MRAFSAERSSFPGPTSRPDIEAMRREASARAFLAARSARRARGRTLLRFLGTTALLGLALVAGIAIGPATLRLIEGQSSGQVARVAAELRALDWRMLGEPRPAAVAAQSPAAGTGEPARDADRLRGEVADLDKQRQSAEQAVLAMLDRSNQVWSELAQLEALRQQEVARLGTAQAQAGQRDEAMRARESAAADAAILAMLSRSDRIWRELEEVDTLRAREAARLVSVSTRPESLAAAEDAVLAMLSRTDRIWRELEALDSLRARETLRLGEGRAAPDPSRSPEDALIAMVARGGGGSLASLAEVDAIRGTTIAGTSPGRPPPPIARLGGVSAEDALLAMLARTDRIWRELEAVDALRARETAQLAAASPGSARSATAATTLPVGAVADGVASEAELRKIMELYERTVTLDREIEAKRRAGGLGGAAPP